MMPCRIKGNCARNTTPMPSIAPIGPSGRPITVDIDVDYVTMSTEHPNDGPNDDDVYRDCISITHATAGQYDDEKTFDTSAWAAVAVDTAHQYIND